MILADNSLIMSETLRNEQHLNCKWSKIKKGLQTV